MLSESQRHAIVLMADNRLRACGYAPGGRPNPELVLECQREWHKRTSEGFFYPFPVPTEELEVLVDSKHIPWYIEHCPKLPRAMRQRGMAAYERYLEKKANKEQKE